MKITLCGSMHHIDSILKAKDTLEELGYEVETPDLDEKSGYEGLANEERAAKKDRLIRQHLSKIGDSDAILVINEEKKGIAGYIGGNSLMEMAFAYAQNIEVFLLNDAKDMGYADEIYGMQPIVLGGKVGAVDNYFKTLPKTYVSSRNPVKWRAVSRGMRRAGIKTQILSWPTESSVSAQPLNIEETYRGAENRHDNLKSETAKEQPGYLATVESGNHMAHSKHNYFSSTVVILEKVGFERKIGINLELEIPKEMTDKVPSIYPDLGVLVQTEYGSDLKDPFPFFTNGKINRLQLVENAVFNVAVQLKA